MELVFASRRVITVITAHMHYIVCIVVGVRFRALCLPYFTEKSFATHTKEDDHFLRLCMLVECACVDGAYIEIAPKGYMSQLRVNRATRRY